MELGKLQTLEILRITPSGAFLNVKKHDGDYAEDVLLPGKQIPEGKDIGDKIDVFIYRDSEDRMIATTQVPKLKLGEIALLQVVDANETGAFLDWGLSKDLLLPFHEQSTKVKVGEYYLVGLYIDNTLRLCATMDVSKYLSLENFPYQTGDVVSCIIYKIVKNLGAFVAIDQKYPALVPLHEMNPQIRVGESFMGRIARIREDQKVDISLREKISLQIALDADNILAQLKEAGGFLPFHDKSSPEEIKGRFSLSKQSFKRAIGRLFKQGEIEITETGIQVKKI